MAVARMERQRNPGPLFPDFAGASSRLRIPPYTELQSNLGTTLVCIIAAQMVMVPVAILVRHKADVWGRKPIFATALAALAIRGALYPLSDNPYWLVSVQLLDGVDAGDAAEIWDRPRSRGAIIVRQWCRNAPASALQHRD